MESATIGASLVVRHIYAKGGPLRVLLATIVNLLLDNSNYSLTVPSAQALAISERAILAPFN